MKPKRNVDSFWVALGEHKLTWHSIPKRTLRSTGPKACFRQTFQIYKTMYAYDRRPLNAVSDGIVD